MPFITKPDYSDNRQIKQFQLTSTQLSGTTVFGIDDAYIPVSSADTINIDALQYTQTRGLIFPNSIPVFTGATYQVLGRDDSTGKVVEVDLVADWENSGLESINEGNQGWRLIGKDPANYGNTGLRGVDISHSTGASSTRGSIGTDSFTTGSDNENTWVNTIMGGLDNIDITVVTGASTNFTNANIIVSAKQEIGNNLIGNAIFGERSFISQPDTYYQDDCFYLNIHSGGNNNFYGGHSSAMFGALLESGSGGVTVVGIGNLDETVTPAGNGSALKKFGGTNTPRFVVGCGLNPNYSVGPVGSGTVGTRQNGFVVWGDGSAKFPVFTNSMIDAANDDSAVTKGWINFNFSGGTSGSTDDYTTGATLSGETLEFTRLSGGTYSVELTGFTGNTAALIYSGTSIHPTQGVHNALGEFSTIGGGTGHTVTFKGNTIAGGRENRIAGKDINDARYSTISGGYNNAVSGNSTTIGGGEGNRIEDNYDCFSTIGGGQNNIIWVDRGTISGGYLNKILLTGSSSTIGGGYINTANAAMSTIGGGRENSNSGGYGVIGGGQDNLIVDGGHYGTIAGGRDNTITIDGFNGAIGGGRANTVSEYRGTIGGGFENTASGPYSTVSGGYRNIAGDYYSTVTGGFDNTASGRYSTASGYYNTAWSYGETSIGLHGTLYTGTSQTAWSYEDRLFNIGNGTGTGARSDAFQILKSGEIIGSSLSTDIIASGDPRTLITKEYLSGATGTTTSPAGSDTEIQFNNAGSFGANTGFTWDGTKLHVEGQSSGEIYAAMTVSTVDSGTGRSQPLNVSLSDTSTDLTDALSGIGLANLDKTNNNYSSWNYITLDTLDVAYTFGNMAVQFVNHTAGAKEADYVFNLRDGGGGVMSERMRIAGGTGYITGDRWVTNGGLVTEFVKGDGTLGAISGITSGATANTDDFTTGATFNTTSRLLELTRQSGATYNVDITAPDRLLEVGNTGPTLSLDFDAYELWRGTVDEAVTISIANGKPKVATVDLTGDFAITYPANSTVVGDEYNGNNNNTLTIHYIDASNILIIIVDWGATTSANNDYTTSASLAGKILEFTRLSGGTYNVELTGFTNDDYTTSASLTGETLEFTRLSGGTYSVELTGFTGIGGSIATDEVAVGSGTDTIEGTGNFTYNGASRTLFIGSDDVARGQLSLYSHSTTGGGKLNLFNEGDADGDDNSYSVEASNGEFILKGVSTGTFFTYNSAGQHIEINDYGSGSKTGTASYVLAVDSSGKIIEEAFSGLTGTTTINTDDYVTGATFNTGDGVITLDMLSGGTVTVDIDGRYTLTGDTVQSNWDEGDSGEGSFILNKPTILEEVLGDPTPQLGGHLDLNNYAITEDFTLGETILSGDCAVMHSDEQMYKSTTLNIAGVRGVCGFPTLSGESGDTRTFILFGKAEPTYSGGTPTIGNQAFMALNGLVHDSLKTETGYFNRVIGHWISTTQIMFNPSPDFFENI